MAPRRQSSATDTMYIMTNDNITDISPKKTQNNKTNTSKVLSYTGTTKTPLLPDTMLRLFN